MGSYEVMSTTVSSSSDNASSGPGTHGRLGRGMIPNGESGTVNELRFVLSPERISLEMGERGRRLVGRGRVKDGNSASVTGELSAGSVMSRSMIRTVASESFANVGAGEVRNGSCGPRIFRRGRGVVRAVGCIVWVWMER